MNKDEIVIGNAIVSIGYLMLSYANTIDEEQTYNLTFEQLNVIGNEVILIGHTILFIYLQLELNNVDEEERVPILLEYYSEILDIFSDLLRMKAAFILIEKAKNKRP